MATKATAGRNRFAPLALRDADGAAVGIEVAGEPVGAGVGIEVAGVSSRVDGVSYACTHVCP